ncbi:nuclear transport factor 2 family protein [Phenylobacterium sp.]|uniref:nuclear transport factor 2 family protein n=1 Tax=Phenylobacterium sp. TaxID=1871053 RepID=UPI0025E04950|nr:nuclear transport factor 2 family protein [Phenylobacterium sp.]
MLNTLRLARMLPMAAGVLGLAVGAPALAAKMADAGPLATVRTFLNAFNKGDIPAAEATYAADVSIIDEVPPHLWRGPGAFQAWAGDLDKHDKGAGLSAEKVTFNRADVVTISGDDA